MFAALRSKKYSYLTDDNNEKNQSKLRQKKVTQKCVIKWKLNFKNIKIV